MRVKIIMTTMLLLSIITFTTAQEHSIDISGIKQEEYNTGEEIVFKIILLKNKTQIKENVTYKISDALSKKEITNTILSDQEESIEITNEFPSGIWTIQANYLDKEVKRNFIIEENPEIKFSIENDELIIKNTGNVRYTKTIQIKIGNEKSTYVQNIRAGDQKILKLISANGKYDIEVTDGKTTLKRKNVQLFGTGNVVGAIDKNLIGYTGFAGAGNIEDMDDQKIPLTKLPLSLFFIAAIAILAALVFVEQKLAKKRKMKK